MNKKPKITNAMQEVAADILTTFMFCNNMEDVWKAWANTYKYYGLHDDPFTQCPCSDKEYCENSLEYDRQLMDMRYGNHDGL